MRFFAELVNARVLSPESFFTLLSTFWQPVKERDIPEVIFFSLLLILNNRFLFLTSMGYAIDCERLLCLHCDDCAGDGTHIAI